MTKPIKITESVGITGEFSAETPVLTGVKLVGTESKKGRRYPLSVLSKHVSLYEGKPCYVDHPERGKQREPRTFASKFAVYRNARIGPDGIYADMHCNPKHQLFEQFQGWVETAPDQVGLSHSAYCLLKEGADGVPEVTEIHSVESVDLVATPATTHGLFESSDMEDDLMSDPVAPAEPGAPTLDSAIAQLVAAIMADSSLDTKAKGKKILHVLKLDEKEAEAKTDEAEPADEEGKEDEKDDKESDYEKKAEEAIGRVIDKKLGKLVEEAVARFTKVKAPVSKPSPKSDKKLTVETLLEGFN